MMNVSGRFLAIAFLTSFFVSCQSPVAEPGIDSSLSDDTASLAIGFESGDAALSVSADLTLAIAGPRGSAISWASSDVAVIENGGAVHRPAYGQGNAPVSLVATLSKGGESRVKSFDLIVLALPAADAPTISGLSDIGSPSRELHWSWSSDDPAALYRFAINTDESASGADFSAWGSTSNASIAAGDGWRYLHVQAKNDDGSVSDIRTVKGFLDNTGPAAFAVSVACPAGELRPSWSWEADADRASYRVSLDAADAWIDIGSALSFVPDLDLGAGEHSLFVQASDSLGNRSASMSAAASVEPGIAPWHAYAGTGYGGAYRALLPIAGGGVVAAGESSAPGQAGDGDAVAARYDSDGAPRWRALIGSEDSESFYGACEASGGYAFVGQYWRLIVGTGMRSNALLVKTDADGALQWAKSYAQEGFNVHFNGCVSLSDGMLALGKRGNNDVGTDTIILRLDDSGAILWAKAIGGGYPSGPRIGYTGIEVSDGYIIGADRNSSTGALRDSWLFKLSKSDGSLLWQRQYQKTGDRTPAIQALSLGSDGTLWAAGTNEYDAVFLPINPATGEFAAGKSAFKYPMGSAIPDSRAYMAAVQGGGFVIASSNNAGGGAKRFWAARLDGAGAAIWQRFYGAASGSTAGLAAAQGEDGRLYFAGAAAETAGDVASCLIVSPDYGSGAAGAIESSAAIAKAAFSGSTAFDPAFAIANIFTSLSVSDLSVSLSVTPF
jgi:hypothetical protein